MASTYINFNNNGGNEISTNVVNSKNGVPVNCGSQSSLPMNVGSEESILMVHMHMMLPSGWLQGHGSLMGWTSRGESKRCCSTWLHLVLRGSWAKRFLM